ncbi:MAG: hypothetical protein RL701_2361, partial [Pseudomonadota bacterium]
MSRAWKKEKETESRTATRTPTERSAHSKRNSRREPNTRSESALPLANAAVEPFTGGHGSLRTPKGMGDLLPPEAEERRALTRVVINTFERSGYDLIVTPLFEHAAVVERGSDAIDPRDL